MDFAPFKDTVIRGIKVDNIDKSNSWFKQMEEYVKSIGGVLSYIKVNEDMTFKSTLDKFMSDEVRDELKKKLALEPDNVVFIMADKKKCAKLMGSLRIKLGQELGLIDNNRFEFCIVYDFPMYEWNEEEKKWDFEHNPFNMPRGGLEALKGNPADVVANQYDFVCNGNKMASGAVRNHDVEIMKKVFEIAK